MTDFDASMLSIRSIRQHFFDDLLIESVENVERVVHRPTRDPASPVLKADRPWEHVLECTVSAVSVLRDPKDGLFKCWYMEGDNNPQRLAKVGKLADPLSQMFRVCYAQSADGLTWDKPLLGIQNHNGQDTNIVLGGPDYGSVYAMDPIIDPHEPDPHQRFKSLYAWYPLDLSWVQTVAVHSADGIHWKPFAEKPSFGKSGPRCDDVAKMFYDPVGRLFVMTTRHDCMYAGSVNLNNPRVGTFTIPHYPHDYYRCNKRRIFQSESPDFLHWTEPYLILAPQDGFDGIDHTFYGMPQFDLGDVRVGFLNVFRYVQNDLKVQLVYSRNGKQWRRFDQGQTWLDRGAPGAWDSVMVAIENRPIPVGDEWFIYYGGATCHHDWWLMGCKEDLDVPEAHDLNLANYAVGLLRIRQEGIVGMHANHVRQGIMITRPLISAGSKLVINAECGRRGAIDVEVVDAMDRVLPGFSRQDCDTFQGDQINHTVSWRGKTEMPVQTERAPHPEPENERFRKFRFFLRDAEIYAMQLV
ncbi:hypothetical protein HQ590_08095 [bacterium]|nr:hypothetical protein [bacterium]